MLHTVPAYCNPYRVGNQRSNGEGTSLLLGKIIWHRLAISLPSLVANSINMKCYKFYIEIATGNMIPLNKTSKRIAYNTNNQLLHAKLLHLYDH